MDRERNLIDFERMYWQLSRKVEHLWKEIYVQTFPGSQSHIMFLLQQSGPKKMSELAGTLHLTAGAVTSASDHLVKHGYINRMLDEKDRRIIRLELTDKGRNTLVELQNEGRKIMKTVFKDVPDEELNMITRIFKQATIHMRDLE